MKEKYQIFCDKEPTVPLFSQPWWLDAVCGPENWDVALVETGGAVVGSMPYYVHKKYGFTILTQPRLTQTLGPWIRPSQAKYARALGYQKDVMAALIKQLPSFAYFSQSWHHSNTNWLPFYWDGFKQTTRYTYLLKELGDEDKIWGSLTENVRTDVRKAANRYQLTVRQNATLADFLILNRKTFERQGMAVPYPETLVQRLDKASALRGRRRIFIAEDPTGQHHAGVYIVWDQQTAYYLLGGADPELRSSGATSLCMWEAIKYAAGVSHSFDFEGSMLEPVERFVRAFGAVQTPYFNISKTPSRLLRLKQALDMVRKG